MKKILLAVFLIVFTSFYTPQVKADISFFNTKILHHAAENLKMACVASKLSNSVMAIGGTLLSIPMLYIISNYISSKLLRKKQNESFFCRFSKISSKLIANLGLTIAGASVISYQLNKLDISPNIMEMLGHGSWAERIACNKLIWPYIKVWLFFKEEIANNINH